MTAKANKSCFGCCKKTHPQCIVCSLTNAKGLHLHFELIADGVRSIFTCDNGYEGYPGILHGGVISSILDGAMGNCMFARGLTAVTIEMKTRFRHPVRICEEAIVSARITRCSHPLYLLEAEIVQNGIVKATAKGKFYDQPNLAKLWEGL